MCTGLTARGDPDTPRSPLSDTEKSGPPARRRATAAFGVSAMAPTVRAFRGRVGLSRVDIQAVVTPRRLGELARYRVGPEYGGKGP